MSHQTKSVNLIRNLIRCETYRTTPSVTQCYKCQGFNHVAKDCKTDQKCVRCGGPHKSTDYVQTQIKNL